MTTTTPCAALCAEDGKPGGNCPNPGVKMCSKCQLVGYCSVDCQKSHWALHRQDCKSKLAVEPWFPDWVTEGRHPGFFDEGPPYQFLGKDKYLWGNVPALDVLNLPENEGLEYEKEVAILFAACGDLRNVVKTINKLPVTYGAPCSIHINDHDIDVVVRATMLLLLGFSDPSDANIVDCMIHLWYSAFLTPEHRATIDRCVRPVVEEVVGEIKNKQDDLPVEKTVQKGKVSLRIILQKTDWIRMLDMLDRNLDPDHARISRNNLLCHRKDFLHRDLLMKRGYQRTTCCRFRDTGILKPFGADVSDFTATNMTLFDANGHWQLNDSANPLDGWSGDEIHDLETPVARPTNDVYGHLYLYLQEQMALFRRRCQSQPVSFVLTAIDLRQLTKVTPTSQFDRIEVSNVVDIGYINVGQTLASMKPLMSKSNPHSTIVSLFLNAIACVEQDRKHDIMRDLMFKLQRYLPAERPPLGHSDPLLIRQLGAIQLLFPFDQWFAEYVENVKIFEAAALLGFQPKKANTIVDEWPFRFRPGLDEEQNKEEFRKVLSSCCTGCERYVEWQLMEGQLD